MIVRDFNDNKFCSSDRNIYIEFKFESNKEGCLNKENNVDQRKHYSCIDLNINRDEYF